MHKIDLHNPPAWAKAVIIAESHIDNSDPMSDYHGHTCTREVFLAWSRHTRDLFSELRKAALLYAETCHLGPGKDGWAAHVVFASDISAPNAYYNAGQPSPWHNDMMPELAWGRGKEFDSEAAAKAWVSNQPEPEPLHMGGSDVVANFRWHVYRHQNYEHREKYSMGSGYYLKAGYSDSNGWCVKKRPLSWFATERLEIVPLDETGKSCPLTVTEDGPVTMTVNMDKGGVELRFPARPDDVTLARIKAAGWRWSRFSRCWYTKDTPEARDFAARVVSLCAGVAGVQI